MIELATGYKDLMHDGYTNCPARTHSCEGKSLRECRMCPTFDYEVFMYMQGRQLKEERPRPSGNCPNCGAPITGDRCEYCGTLHREGGAWT